MASESAFPDPREAEVKPRVREYSNPTHPHESLTSDCVESDLFDEGIEGAFKASVASDWALLSSIIRALSQSLASGVIPEAITISSALGCGALTSPDSV